MSFALRARARSLGFLMGYIVVWHAIVENNYLKYLASLSDNSDWRNSRTSLFIFTSIVTSRKHLAGDSDVTS